MTRPTIGLLLTLALSLLVASLAAEAQPPVTIPRVGGLRPKPPSGSGTATRGEKVCIPSVKKTAHVTC